MGKKLTLEIITERLVNINNSIKILSDNYVNSKTGIKCKCLICGNEWSPNWESLKSGKGCPKCFGKTKLNLLVVKERLLLINKNIKIVSEDYVNSRKPMKCKCLIKGCNYEWEASWDSLKTGNGCARCSRVEKLNINIIKERLACINPNIRILDSIYINAHTDLNCECLTPYCKHNWKSTWNSLSSGNGCRECANRKLRGENHYCWKGGISPLHEYLRGKIAIWKKDSFKKYNYKCDVTGIFDRTILIHHPYNFSNILQETMEILKLPIHQEINKYTNEELKSIEDKFLELHYKYGLGVCLTEEVHKEFHATYGKDSNTIEQYEEFKICKRKELMEAV